MPSKITFSEDDKRMYFLAGSGRSCLYSVDLEQGLLSVSIVKLVVEAEGRYLKLSSDPYAVGRGIDLKIDTESNVIYKNLYIILFELITYLMFVLYINYEISVYSIYLFVHKTLQYSSNRYNM